jgi:ABC-2 type transport system ATP-binding protein
MGLTRTFGDLKALDALVASTSRLGSCSASSVLTDPARRPRSASSPALLRPTDGDATVVGTSVVEDPEGVKHRIAYMSQRFGLYGDLSDPREHRVLRRPVRRAA